ncbi:5521_t:CDS:2 [Gigaspora margarita]|uniref:5521_t:CDS:1 n=1 Tax=Gigaspora margarita TaxID=4874 RepID=A0ABN7UCP2_GIGMA|nr:5521_t:CDS:2 [Gigaspora margarita]
MVVLKKLNNSQDITADFLREITYHKLVDNDVFSPVVSCYGISQDPQSKNYVMITEYMGGGNLKEYLQNNCGDLNFELKLKQLLNIAKILTSNPGELELEYEERADNLTEQEFEKYLEKIEDPNYEGGAYDLPENPTPLEKMKYDICQNILGYKLTSHSTTQQIAQQIQLSTAETEELLFCRIEKFTLDRLVVYASKLFSPSHM